MTSSQLGAILSSSPSLTDQSEPFAPTAHFDPASGRWSARAEDSIYYPTTESVIRHCVVGALVESNMPFNGADIQLAMDLFKYAAGEARKQAADAAAEKRDTKAVR